LGLCTIGRNTQGARVINLNEGDRVIDMTRLPKSGDEIFDYGSENGRIVEASKGETARRARRNKARWGGLVRRSRS
jgi:hypothetical protein